MNIYEKIKFIKEVAEICNKFMAENLDKVNMSVSNTGGLNISFFKVNKKKSTGCELRKFEFNYFDDEATLKSKKNKLKRFLNSKEVFKYNYGADLIEAALND